MIAPLDPQIIADKATTPLQLLSKERFIFYYGVEQTGWMWDDVPKYTKGVWMVRLGPWDDERQLREIIEARCRANPNGAFLGHLFPDGFPMPFFRWIN